MSDDREFLRATASWLEAGSDRTPPHAIDAVLLAVRSTRQDRPLPLARRVLRLPVTVRVALVAAALVALALVTVNLILVAGHRQAPTETGPNLVPVMVADGDSVTHFRPGVRYTTVKPFPVRMTFTGPPGWEGKIGGPNAVWLGPPNPGDEPLFFHVSIYPYVDPCHPDNVTVNPPPTTVSGVVDALTAHPGIEVTDPAATIGGRPATLLTATAPGSLADCTGGVFSLWELPLGAVVSLTPGATLSIWVVDVGAPWPLVIGAEDDPAWPPQVRAATDQLLESLQIEPSS